MHVMLSSSGDRASASSTPFPVVLLLGQVISAHLGGAPTPHPHTCQQLSRGRTFSRSLASDWGEFHTSFQNLPGPGFSGY